RRVVYPVFGASTRCGETRAAFFCRSRVAGNPQSGQERPPSSVPSEPRGWPRGGGRSCPRHARSAAELALASATRTTGVFVARNMGRTARYSSVEFRSNSSVEMTYFREKFLA